MSNTTEAAVIFEHFLAQLERANTLEKRVWILEKENTALKQEAGYCVDEGCDHANTIHVCSTASVTKDVINNALIGSSIISKADTQLQADIEALTERVADLEERKPTPVYVDSRSLSICRRELFELKARYGYEALHCAFQEISK